MGKLNIDADVSARAVFDFFEQISEIPRGSGNTKKIADYLVSFAKTRRLIYERDSFDNVIIKKGATEGYESRPTVIIQGHTDIVADKIKTSQRDLLNEGLDIYLDGDFIRARETTLGGDDGIAVAYALALLDARDIPHPAIEAVFTSDEEIGLIGAGGLDTKSLDGKIMINVDSDDEGVFTVGCAGGLRMDLDFDVLHCERANRGYELSLSGLMGGHSGVEINRGRLNAIKCVGKILSAIKDVRLSKIDGGNADNAIPRDAAAVFSSNMPYDELLHIVKNTEKALKEIDTGAILTLNEVGNIGIYSENDSKRVIRTLDFLPSGVIAMEEKMPDMVQTSMNVGIIETHKAGITVSASLRSSKKDAKAALKARVRAIGESEGARVGERGEYPEWEYKPESHLRTVMEEVYREQYGKEPSVITIHAGLECGIFSEKIEGLDCVSIGPDGFDIHTPDERLSVSSAVRVWKFIKEVLKRI